MRTRKRQWAALLAVPLLIALVMWPVAVRRRERIRAQEATRALVAAMESQQDIRPAVVERLIAQGADINVRTSSGTTPLMMAVLAGKPEVVRLLLDHGAQVNLRRGSGVNTQSALTLAREGLGTLINNQLGYILDAPAQPEELNVLTPQQERAAAPQLRNARRIITMLKAAGAHE